MIGFTTTETTRGFSFASRRIRGRRNKKGVVPIRSLKAATSALVTAAALATFALPAAALDIYEPDSHYHQAPNGLLSALATEEGEEVQAKVGAKGAELVSTNPQYANAVVMMGANGKLHADVYIKLQRVLRLQGDDGVVANAIATRLNKAFAGGTLRADRILPARRGKDYVIMLDRQPLVTIDRKLAAAQGAKPGGLVLKWMDNIRLACGGVPFATTASRGAVPIGGTMVGHASWYGPGFHGRRAADGSRFDQNAMTAAHKTLPFGTLLLVTNPRNKKSVIVRITDRGPYIPGRVLDLSAAAAREIGISGVGNVRMDILRP